MVWVGCDSAGRLLQARSRRCLLARACHSWQVVSPYHVATTAAHAVRAQGSGWKSDKQLEPPQRSARTCWNWPSVGATQTSQRSLTRRYSRGPPVSLSPRYSSQYSWNDLIGSACPLSTTCTPGPGLWPVRHQELRRHRAHGALRKLTALQCNGSTSVMMNRGCIQARIRSSVTGFLCDHVKVFMCAKG